MDKWEERKRPVRLERRFEFDNYDATRDFLDRLGEHSELAQRFPDISFGRTYVNITIRPDNDEDIKLNDQQEKFAIEIDGICD